MIHPLFKLLASRPELVAHHVANYGQLVAVQAGEAAAQLQHKAILAVVALLGAGVGLGLGGMALLFFAAIPLDQMAHPWLLLLVPLTPLVAAVVCVLLLRSRPAAWSLDTLRGQLRSDAALLREVSAR